MNDISLELGLDDKPMILVKTDFLAIYKLPQTMSLKIELRLPKYQVEETEENKKKHNIIKQRFGEEIQYDMILSYEDIEKIHSLFDEHHSVVAYIDGCSLKNPGRVNIS